MGGIEPFDTFQGRDPPKKSCANRSSATSAAMSLRAVVPERPRVVLVLAPLSAELRAAGASPVFSSPVTRKVAAGRRRRRQPGHREGTSAESPPRRAPLRPA